MSSPYEDDVVRLIAMRKEQLKELEEGLQKNPGWFSKKKLQNKIARYKNDIEYLEMDIARYRRAMEWLRKTGDFSEKALREHAAKMAAEQKPAAQPAKPAEQKQ